MKRIIILLIILVSCTLIASATHNMGGSIIYKHISNLTYEITVFTYTDPSSSADRPILELYWGDGSSDSITRISQVTTGNNILKNTYKGIHTYPSSSNYIISVTDPNRNSNILNIPNSVNVIFYIESELIIPTINDFNNSVDFLAPPIFNCKLGRPFKHSLSAYDIDGDELSFELIPPKKESGQSILGYVFPDSLSINIINGEIVWNSPHLLGSYVVALKITECRNGVKVGSVIVDIQINVVLNSFPAAQFQELSAWQIDTNNNYSVKITPNDSIQLNLAYYDGFTSTIDIEAYGEAFIGSNNGTFQIDSLSNGYSRKIFKWNPDATNIRCSPYIITFRGSVNQTSTEFNKDLTLMVYVHDQSMTNCDSTCNTLLISVRDQVDIENDNILFYPNPFNSQTKIIISNFNETNYNRLTIYNLWGEKVNSIPISNKNEVIITRDNLPSGIYIYHLENDLSNIASGKLIITD
ncbi:MAG: hypothetical protein COB15_17265 [Flavobacteriales bacterium]|nr:MAG: hypothetical protein COB15_17265 [Flavobacteriales bacterium]